MANFLANTFIILNWCYWSHDESHVGGQEIKKYIIMRKNNETYEFCPIFNRKADFSVIVSYVEYNEIF